MGGISLEGFQRILKFCEPLVIPGQPRLKHFGPVSEYLVAIGTASYLGMIMSMEKLCAHIQRNLDHNNVVQIWRTAQAHGIDRLCEYCCTFVCKTFDYYVYQEKRMGKLSFDMLHAVLKDGKVSCNTN